MALTPTERKAKLPFGAMTVIAKRCRIARTTVSEGIAGTWRPKTNKTRARLRRMQVETAAILGVPLEEAWQPDELAASEPIVFARAS